MFLPYFNEQGVILDNTGSTNKKIMIHRERLTYNQGTPYQSTHYLDEVISAGGYVYTWKDTDFEGLGPEPGETVGVFPTMIDGWENFMGTTNLSQTVVIISGITYIDECGLSWWSEYENKPLQTIIDYNTGDYNVYDEWDCRMFEGQSLRLSKVEPQNGKLYRFAVNDYNSWVDSNNQRGGLYNIPKFSIVGYLLI